MPRRSKYTLNIIYEDEALLVIDKPAGLPTLPGDDPTSSSLASELALTHPEIASMDEFGIAHRLDNDTSGLLCVGKTRQSYEHLREQFKTGGVNKTYIALVLGYPPSEGSIDAPIAHHPRKKGKMVVCESNNRAKELKGRRAHTRYEIIKRYEGYTLLKVDISTGVRHQIRAHLAWQGFPIAGDALYQNPKKRAEDNLPLERHFLHASQIQLIHPTSGNLASFSSNPPPDLARVLKNLTNRK